MAKENSETAIWTEKYRPKEFEDVVGQEEIVLRVKAFVEAKNMPHLLFAGPAGTGKSTLAIIIAKKFFGNAWHDNFLELNASDERGIDVVRQKVKSFARTKALSTIPFKLIFLDESDALTKDAQHALRRTMEMYTETCRFVLSCNYSSKIIDPIQSRCAVFRFKPLVKADITKIIEKICERENLQINQRTVDELFSLSEGDCRRVINMLQASASVSKEITQELIYKIASAAKPQDVKLILETASTGNFSQAREMLLDTMLKQGLSGQDIIKEIQRQIWGLSIPDEKKVLLTEKTGEIEFRIVEGSDEFIQLEALLASFVAVGK
ncbi:replication factor C small subunit [Candidatus Pacearchaeota archaeon CG06_land_8_20_14_3_00_35_12]|nr:MAG: replication factor C small subunit [Candidatus Pacearchaeota archaeon CG06_land_8_20_14_3_00_35_12]